jgi:hypothetical protein
MTPDEIIEAGAKAIFSKRFLVWEGDDPMMDWPPEPKLLEAYRAEARACLEATCHGLLTGTHAVLPLEATEEMEFAPADFDERFDQFGEVWSKMVAAYLASKDKPT